MQGGLAVDRSGVQKREAPCNGRLALESGCGGLQLWLQTAASPRLKIRLCAEQREEHRGLLLGLAAPERSVWFNG